ncbi:MAG TPA: hypothetical protein VKS24_24975 [Bradyrhizobium sp.]|nr:hypothetical protein [Bradyrhizobium sp.]
MATGAWPTLLDVAQREGPDGKQLFLAEMLSQTNEILDDTPFVEANEKTGHEFGFRDSIPAGAWRSYNMGVGYSKSTAGKSRVGIGTLAAWSQVDRDLAEDSGDPEAFRESEDIAFMEGLSQTWAEALIYGNTAAIPSQFMGLAPFYNTASTGTAKNAANVIDAKGVGSSNTSFWGIGWNEGTFYCVFPRAGKAGLDMFDRGDTVPAYDTLGNPFAAFTTEFRWRGGLVPQDWRNGVRIANIDTTAAGLQGPNAPDLFSLLAQMMYLFPALGKRNSGIGSTDAPRDRSVGVRAVIYVNRTGRHWMDIQATRDRNVLLSIDDYAGNPTMGYRDVPIRIVDQIVNSESRVT